MASFAKIGLNGKVIEVLSINNDVLKDANGVSLICIAEYEVVRLNSTKSPHLEEETGL